MAQLSLATSSVRISGYRLVQTVQDLAYIYIPEGQAHVEFCASLNCVNVPSNMYTQASPVETKLQRTGTRSATAWQIPCLCYRPLVAFLHHCLIALSLPQWKIRTFHKKCRVFLNICFESTIVIRRKCVYSNPRVPSTLCILPRLHLITLIILIRKTNY